MNAADEQEVRESARRSRDGARTELQHHEETLVASTRETDRLLSEYKYVAIVYTFETRTIS